MAARKPATAPVGEFISMEDAERMAQVAAGRVLATMPDPEPEPPAEPDPDDIALQNVLAELGTSSTEAKVNIYQLDARQNRAFVGAFLPSEFSLEKVQADFGPGDYEIRVYDAGRLATRKVVKIAAPKNQPALLAPAPVAALETGKILETMQNGFREMGTMFANALSGLAANQPKPKTTMEMLQEMTMMRELLGGNQPAQTGPDPMKLFEMATQIAEKIQPRVGEPGAGEVIMEAIKNFGPALSQAAQNAAMRAPAMPVLPAHTGPVPQMTPIPPHTGSAPEAVPLTQPAPENSQMDFARKMYLNLLISNAAHDNDPSTYAQLMLDVAGETQALEFANAPDWFEKLCAEDARAAQYKPWFEELRGMVIELTKPELTNPEMPVMNGGNEDKTGNP